MLRPADLGNINGSLLLFGGVYSNLHALQTLRSVAEERNIAPSNIICTGDIIGYCAFPDECVRFIRDWGIHSIKGNVEFNIVEEEDDCGCNFEEGSRCDVLSKIWFPYALKHTSREAKAYLKTLPEFISFGHRGKRYFVLHGSVRNTGEFIFRSTPWEVKAHSFTASGHSNIVAGHCGLPFIQKNGDETWVNAGVIGMPANDGSSATWFAILSEDGVVFENLRYDAVAAQKAMRDKGLPEAYAETLLTGVWDNCDILPEEETLQQGKPILI